MTVKIFDPARDIISQPQSINEYIMVGGSIFTGAVQNPGVDNIKTFTHWTSASVNGGYYQAVYNVHYTSSAAVELIDIAYGQSVSSAYYLSPSGTNKAEKNKVYKLYAKHLLGDEDSFFNIDSANKHELIFMSIRRNQFKDEIKKGTVVLNTIFSGAGRQSASIVFREGVFQDTNAANSYTETIRGDVATLFSTSNAIAGQIYYQAGVLVLIPERISNTSSVSTDVGNFWSGSGAPGYDYGAMATSGGAATSNLNNMLSACRYRFRNLQFINQSNLHATFYFCRALNDEFNYSSNPSFVDSDGRIVPTSGNNNFQSRTYITKVALIGENNEKLAVAGLSQPIKKDSSTEIVLRVRLDY